jgi:hypothetical protein
LHLPACAALLSAVALAHDGHDDRPYPTAGADGPVATLRYDVRDAGGAPLPVRLTLVAPDGALPKLFVNTDAAPDELAVRQNLVYSLSGRGQVTVPPGSYTVYASRGLEWSIAQQALELSAGQTAAFTAVLRREVDTTGWISGDFHLHTLTHSGHGDANLKERVITLIGEGLDFAVATDHNHNTDYAPTVTALGLTGRIATAVGNEVSTSIGHFNAFPLDPSRPVPPPQSYDANQLFKLIRAETNPFGVVPVIQLNHPRWGDIDYFGRTRLDPVTGVGLARTYSDDFDTIEIFNENEGWGYEDADITRDLNVGSSKHSVLRDWFNLLNRGQRYAAVGNSDSHHVQLELAGYPRNFVASPTDDPAAIRVEDVAGALRARRCFTTRGPFAEFQVNDAPVGGETVAASGHVTLALRVQAASWIDCDRVKIVVNGDVVEEIPVPQTRAVERLCIERPLAIDRDCWIAVLIEGDDPLHPIVHTQDRPIRPLAVLNPVWVRTAADRPWRSPWRQAQDDVAARAAAALSLEQFAGRRESERALLLLAAVESRHRDAAALVRAGFTDRQRLVRLMAARAAALLADPALTADLDAARAAAAADPFLQLLTLAALKTAGVAELTPRVFAFVDAHDSQTVQRYFDELEPLLEGGYVRDWRVAGYFDNPRRDTLATVAYDPEVRPELTAEYRGKREAVVRWTELRADRKGYLDLRQIDPRKEACSNAIAYAQCALHSPDARRVRYAFGSDDGSRVWLNGVLDLQAGWNRVLVKVENGDGGFGLYFRVFDAAVRTAADTSAPDTRDGSN